MRRLTLWSVVVLLAVVPARADQKPSGRLIEETWDTAYVEGARAGYYHTTVHELEREGKKVLRTTLTMHLTIRRYNAVVPLRMETSTDEATSGRVLALSLTQFLDQGKAVQTGTVEGDQLVVRAAGDAEGKAVPWNGRVIGPHRQQGLCKERKVKPGDRFVFHNYELALLAAVPVHIAVKEPEEVDLLVPQAEGGRTRVGRVRRKLLRVEAASDKVKVGGSEIPLPRMVSWLDGKYETVRSEMTVPGLGRITLYRTSKDVAQQEGIAPALLPDLGLGTLIPLRQTIDRPHDARAVIYRITLAGDDDPATAFARDARQEARNARDDSFELVVRAQGETGEAKDPKEPGKEFLESSYFLDSAGARVRKLAARAVGAETDPWGKARKIEKWVYENMRPSASVGFNTAEQVAQNLEGDCRQHAMLTAALCRAAGVPSRTAVGLVYVRDPDRGPVLGFHMWTEVWVKGRWLGLDATLGKGRIGPGHLKIADHSWHGVQTLAPLLPVTRVMGRARIEIVRVEK